ncbi:hypothetical protein Poly51_25630 [Rubripirellula tenax]|uniref:Uncharacterized protein n=1 Tax=Rubripirellula tenax TaxID=2528015 RepID=A0A5C6F8G4_9BACT|nr:hypothetical protein [Rubripirellula tenax]TWU56647.1 hypothetical protein Poly51_25630 [Rubripirellula tenax]
MNAITKIVSLVSLTAVVLPCVLFFFGTVELNVVKWAALAGTIGWFIAAPLWMSNKPEIDDAEVQI